MLERLKKLRKILGLTQSEFANELGVTQAAYSSIENGKYKLTERYIKNICSAFSVNENWFRNGEGSVFANPVKKKEMLEVFTQLSEQSQDYILELAKGILHTQEKYQEENKR